MLEASALNPHDAGAQYQLGLIYQQRRQYGEAIQRFQNAVAIDPREADAHFQLGRIAREQGRLNDALAHFQTVLDLDDKHSQNEILREIGGLYLAAANTSTRAGSWPLTSSAGPTTRKGSATTARPWNGSVTPRAPRNVRALH